MAVATSRLTALQEARLAQVLTVGWMGIEAAVAIVAGVAARSVALTAFGVDSGVELFSSVVVLHRLLQRSESEERGSLTAGERRASPLVGYALFGLWWADPLAALALVWWIRGEAKEAVEAGRG